jgi:hypothetical protein
MRGWSDPHYEPSSTACLQNAFSIAACLETLSEANLHCVRTIWPACAVNLNDRTVLVAVCSWPGCRHCPLEYAHVTLVDDWVR